MKKKNKKIIASFLLAFVLVLPVFNGNVSDTTDKSGIIVPMIDPPWGG